MSLYKRRDSPNWWVKFQFRGRPIQCSSGTSDKTKAREFEDKLRVRLWDEERLGVKPRWSWKEAVVRWVSESKHKATHELDLMHLKWLDRFLGDKLLDEINRALIDRMIAARAAEVSNRSVNMTLQVVRVVLRKALLEWEWLDRLPSFRWLPEPPGRVRWVTREQAALLLSHLPEHLAAMARFSLETGLRKSNVTGLLWSQVDLVRRCAWIHPDQAKARKAIAVPLSSGAVVVLREQIGKHPIYVFTYRGQAPVKQVNTKAWKASLKASEIESFRWHDLRHTWASWHVQAGTPLAVLKELGGWESLEMVQRYAHLSSEHLAQYVERVSGLRLVDGGAVGTKVGTAPQMTKGS